MGLHSKVILLKWYICTVVTLISAIRWSFPEDCLCLPSGHFWQTSLCGWKHPGGERLFTGTHDLREGHIAWGRTYVLFKAGVFFKYVKFKPYKPHPLQNLSPVNVESRLEACWHWIHIGWDKILAEADVVFRKTINNWQAAVASEPFLGFELRIWLGRPSWQMTHV